MADAHSMGAFKADRLLSGRRENCPWRGSRPSSRRRRLRHAGGLPEGAEIVGYNGNMTSESSVQFKPLEELEASALTFRLYMLRKQERELLVEFLLYLGELERRKVHLEIGYSSVFVFLTDHLGYPRASAYRRYTASRLLARFPAIGPHLADGRLNLTTLVELRDVLTEETLAQTVDRAAGRTEEQVRELVAAMKPRPEPDDLLRRLPQPRVEPPAPAILPGLTLVPPLPATPVPPLAPTPSQSTPAATAPRMTIRGSPLRLDPPAAASPHPGLRPGRSDDGREPHPSLPIAQCLRRGERGRGGMALSPSRDLR